MPVSALILKFICSAPLRCKYTSIRKSHHSLEWSPAYTSLKQYLVSGTVKLRDLLDHWVLFFLLLLTLYYIISLINDWCSNLKVKIYFFFSCWNTGMDPLCFSKQKPFSLSLIKFMHHHFIYFYIFAGI